VCTAGYNHVVLLLVFMLAVMALVIAAWLTGLILKKVRRRY